jgi:hypothetical protein
MLDYLRFRYELWQCDRWARRISKKFDKERKEAKARGAKSDELEGITSREMSELHWNDEDLMVAHTRRLSKMAHKLMIEVGGRWDPETKDDWEEGQQVYQYLTPKGMKKLREAIRAEQKARREMFLMWVPVIAGFTGLVGAATGLIALLVKSSR